ncbi:hypothetical protein L6164_013129 [Bauhinia variegata]|uniref:Uncharacterized protein n=1 Tax=Bauhinia variegata TaxID=167791 RepID=A0ACB9PB67_BAUVA|nr:hypothetical protein L6164_013129 [Bauhinia variegata]
MLQIQALESLQKQKECAADEMLAKRGTNWRKLRKSVIRKYPEEDEEKEETVKGDEGEKLVEELRQDPLEVLAIAFGNQSVRNCGWEKHTFLAFHLTRVCQNPDNEGRYVIMPGNFTLTGVPQTTGVTSILIGRELALRCGVSSTQTAAKLQTLMMRFGVVMNAVTLLSPAFLAKERSGIIM